MLPDGSGSVQPTGWAAYASGAFGALSFRLIQGGIHLDSVQIDIPIVVYLLVQGISFHGLPADLADEGHELGGGEAWGLLFAAGHRIDLCRIVDSAIQVIDAEGKRQLGALAAQHR